MPSASWGRRLAPVTLALSLLASVPAAAGPLFGPATYTRTTGAPDVFEESFAVPVGGSYLLSVHNGDGEDNRVSSARVEVNGVVVLDESRFSGQVDVARAPVVLSAGTSTLRVTLSSAPGSFLTVVVAPAREVLDFSAGRLLLPHGTSPGLVLELKNGSHHAPRRVRVVFFDAAGQPVAQSGDLLLAPGASLSQDVAAMITAGAWSEGSIEVFFTGPGAARVFGQARVLDAAGVNGVVELQHAGHRLVRGRQPGPR